MRWNDGWKGEVAPDSYRENSDDPKGCKHLKQRLELRARKMQHGARAVPHNWSLLSPERTDNSLSAPSIPRNYPDGKSQGLELRHRWRHSGERRLERFEWKLDTPTPTARLVGRENQFGGTQRTACR